MYSEMKPSVGICDIQVVLYDKESIHMSTERNEKPRENVVKLHFRNAKQKYSKRPFYLSVFGKQ